MSRKQILVVAPSNAAADNIAEKLNKIAAFKGKFIRLYGDKREDFFHFEKKTLKEKPYRVLSEFINSKLASEDLQEVMEQKGYNMESLSKAQFKKLIEELEEGSRKIIKRKMIVITTCQNTLNAKLEDLVFSRVIIDEASQAKEVEVL